MDSTLFAYFTATILAQSLSLRLLLADPAAGDLQDFGRVAYTIRGGRVIFDATAH
jgi:hypothetical protein